MAQSLGCTHDRGVKHRGSRPCNAILALTSRQRGLVDFETARLLDQGDTGTGSLLGSPATSAPGPLAGKPADTAYDRFALRGLRFAF